MKLNKIHAGIVLAIAANGAYAYSPTTTHDIVIHLGGASAQDANIEATIYNDFCNTSDGNRDRYSYNGSNSLHRAVSCTTVAKGTVPAGKKLLVIKRSDGGSGFGVQPVVFNTAIDFMKVSSGCSAGSAVSGYTYNCTTLETVLPQAGVSDVNPEMFTGQNIPAGFTQGVTSTSGLTVKSAVALAFAPAVSKNLRDELQNQLVAAGKLGATCNGADRETEACMPSVSKHQMASILGGQMVDWQQLTVNGVTDIYNEAVALGHPVPSNTAMKICRRENGSGTQATANAVFLNYPCSSAGIAPTSTLLNPEVVENASAGTLDTCLSDNTRWTVGFQSTEKNASLALNYRFLKVDGVTPTIENVWNGKYIFWSENTFQWQNSQPADVKNVMTQLANDVGTPARIVARNAGFNHSFGQAGYLALLSNGYTADTTFATSNPVTPYQHILGGNLNNCRVPTIDSSSVGRIE